MWESILHVFNLSLPCALRTAPTRYLCQLIGPGFPTIWWVAIVVRIRRPESIGGGAICFHGFRIFARES